MAAVKKAKFNLEQASKAIANYPESKLENRYLNDVTVHRNRAVLLRS